MEKLYDVGLLYRDDATVVVGKNAEGQDVITSPLDRIDFSSRTVRTRSGSAYQIVNWAHEEAV